MQQLIRPLYSKSRFLLRHIPDLDTYIQNRVRLASYNLDNVTIKPAETADFHQLAKTVNKFRTSTRIVERTERGDICIVVYKHGALAHFRWVALKPFKPRELGDQLAHLQSDEAWTYDSYTLPAFRRQGISSEAKVFLMEYLAQQGIRRTYSDSRVDNIQAQQSRIKKVREGRLCILGVVTVTTQLGRTRCTFTADTEATRSLIARLFHVPFQAIPIRKLASK
jgi:GNAT superfamily N-acetyltransferase